MSCSNCKHALPIARCIDGAYSGRIWGGKALDDDGSVKADTDIYVYVRHVGSGRIHQFESTTEADGDFYFDFSAEKIEGQDYEMWVTDANAISMSDNQTIQLSEADGSSTDTDSCWYFQFKDVYDGAGEPVIFTEQTLLI